MLNNNQPLSKEDLDLFNKVKDKTSIIVVNKNDLEKRIDLSSLETNYIVYIIL